MLLLQKPVYSTIEPIINTLKTVGIILDYDQESNTYSWNNLLNEVMIIGSSKTIKIYSCKMLIKLKL